MAAPNLQSPTTITGRTTAFNLTATTEIVMLSNAASSNRAFRVKSVTAGNTGTTGTVDVTLRYYTATSGGTAFPLPAITVPVGGSVILIGAENPTWIEEDRRLSIQASAANFATVILSYEDVT